MTRIAPGVIDTFCTHYNQKIDMQHKRKIKLKYGQDKENEDIRHINDISEDLTKYEDFLFNNKLSLGTLAANNDIQLVNIDTDNTLIFEWDENGTSKFVVSNYHVWSHLLINSSLFNIENMSLNNHFQISITVWPR